MLSATLTIVGSLTVAGHCPTEYPPNYLPANHLARDMLSDPGPDATFTFAFLADTQCASSWSCNEGLICTCGHDSNGNGINNSAEAIFAEIAAYDPDFVIVGGDLVQEGLYHPMQQYRDFVAQYMANTGIPVFSVIGNHDLQDVPRRTNTWANFTELIDDFDSLWDGFNYDGSHPERCFDRQFEFEFDFGDYRFLAVNNVEQRLEKMTCRDEETGAPLTGLQISVDEDARLQNLLSEDGLRSLLFMHAPLPYCAAHVGKLNGKTCPGVGNVGGENLTCSRDAFRDLLDQLLRGNATAAFAGHVHHYSKRYHVGTPRQRGGLYNITAGGASQTTVAGVSEYWQGDGKHWLLVNVAPHELSVQPCFDSTCNSPAWAFDVVRWIHAPGTVVGEFHDIPWAHELVVAGESPGGTISTSYVIGETAFVAMRAGDQITLGHGFSASAGDGQTVFHAEIGCESGSGAWCRSYGCSGAKRSCDDDADCCSLNCLSNNECA